MFLWILACIVSIIFLAIFVFKYIDGNEGYWIKENVHLVPNSSIFKNTLDRYLFRIPFHEIDHMIYKAQKQEKGHKIAGHILFRHPILSILDLDIAKHILVKDFDHFVNRRGIEFSDPKFQDMLFNMINQDWKDLRAIMSPTFTTSKIKRMFGVFNESGQKMVKFLQAEIAKSSDSEIEFRGVCGRYTMDVIASAAFGVDSQNFENENSPFAVHGRMLQDTFGKGLMFKFMLMIIFPSLAKKFKVSLFNLEGITFLESVVKDSIKKRKETGERRNDFLQLMLEAQEESMNNSEIVQSETNLDQYEIDAQLDSKNVNKMMMTDDLLIAQCNLFFIAGFDTTESLLIWACYEMALQPDIQERLYSDILKAINGNKDELSYDTINQIEYLDMVVSETLRKYPAAVRSERKCNKDYKIPNHDYVIKKDTHIMIPTYGIHHDPDIYPDPEKFDPERFNAENKASRHPYAYLPFGHGPRSCIAMRFALVEGKAAVAHLVLNFKFSPGKKTVIPMRFTSKGVLKPENGMWVTLQARN